MGKKPKSSKAEAGLDPKLQAWVKARRLLRLSHAHVHMARELGMNPRKLGGKANHDQEPWKMPLPDYIEHLYEKKFGRERPDEVLTIEELARRQRQKKAEKKERKRLRKEAQRAGPSG